MLRVNTTLRRGLENVEQGFTLGEIAQRAYTIAREEDVVTRMTRKRANMAVVSKAKPRPRPIDVLGIITKEHSAVVGHK